MPVAAAVLCPVSMAAKDIVGRWRGYFRVVAGNILSGQQSRADPPVGKSRTDEPLGLRPPGDVTDCGWLALVVSYWSGNMAQARHKFCDACSLDYQRTLFCDCPELCGQRPQFSSDRSGGGDSPRATIGGDTRQPCGRWLAVVAADSVGGHRFGHHCG